MSKKNRHRLKSSDFFDYMEGKLTGEDRNAFERKIQGDLFNEEAEEGLRMVTREEAEQDLAFARKKIGNRISRRKRITWYSAAAAIASILVVSTIFFNIERNPDTQSERIMEMNKLLEKNSGSHREKKDEVATEIDKKGNEEAEKIMAGDDLPGELDAGIQMKKEKDISAEEEILDQERSEKQTIDQDREMLEDDYTEADFMYEDAGEGAVENVLIYTDDDAVLDEENVAGIIENAEPKEEIMLQQNAAPAKEAEVQPVVADYSMVSENAGTRRAKSAGVTEQPVRIRGLVISSEDSAPLPGATLVLQGTASGVVTDMDGTFEFDVNGPEDKSLIASYIGMENKEVPIDSDRYLNISMEPSLTSLDEVVMVGSGVAENQKVIGGRIVEIDPENVSVYKSATPENGLAAFKDYMDQQLVFPASENELSRAVVVVKFYVLPSGRPHNIEILKSPSDSFSAEARRVILNGPDWIPATRDNVYVDDDLRMRVVFREQHKR